MSNTDDHVAHEQAAQSGPSNVGLATRLSGNPIVGFTPWIIFWIIATGPNTWLYGAGAAAAAALVLAIPDVYRRRPKILDIATIIFFTALTVTGIIANPADGEWIDQYSSVISSTVLGAIALGSLLFVPFTEQYARETTPKKYWHAQAFTRINRVLTLAWGLAFLGIAVCGLIAIAAPSTSAWSNWVIPILLLVCALKFTRWYPDRATPIS